MDQSAVCTAVTSAGTTPRVFTGPERVFAWLTVLAGYGFFRARPVYDYPLGTMLLLWGLFALTMWMLAKNGRKLRGMAAAVCASTLPVSLALFFSANDMIHVVAVLYVFAAYAYTVYAACGNALEEGISDLVPMDLIRALFVMPFASFGSLVSAIGAGKGMKQGGKILLRVFGGLSLALIPTLAVFGLLSYDDGFRDTFSRILDWDGGDLFSHLSSLFFGFLLAMFLFGLYVSSMDNRCREIVTAVQCRHAADRVHSFSTVTACSAAAPVLFLYGVFFFAQWERYTSAFDGILPDGTPYAVYAREGFFELCLVSAVNFGILAATGMFTRRRDQQNNGTESGKTAAHPAVRVLHVVLSVCTLVLIATAMSKMALYIETYGLTPKRVYAAWFMCMLAVVFVLVIVKQFVPKLKLIAVSAGVCVLLFAILGLANVDGMIAEYNVDRYLAGTLEELDVQTLEELGDAAVPARIRAGVYREREWDASPDNGIFTWTLPKLRAVQALDGMRQDSRE